MFSAASFLEAVFLFDKCLILLYTSIMIEKRTWHIWIKNSVTGEVKCKIVKGNNFGYAGRGAFEFSGEQRVKTDQIWYIMSVSDVGFAHDPEVPIV